jgi:hypothetical protein
MTIAKFCRQLAVACAVVSLIGCAADVRRTSAEFRAVEVSQRTSIEVTERVTLNLATGYQRSILTGSRWERIGAVAQGDVYRPVGTVFTIEGANMHEAFLVVQDSKIAGFYLPGEGAFSALDTPVPLPFKSTNLPR